MHWPWVVQAVWGLPQTLVGAAMAMVCRTSASRTFCSVIVREWGLGSGLSLGLFVFVPKGCSRRLLVHEYGHSVQSMLLGPLYLPVVVLPSLVWAGVPALARWRERHGVSYYDMPTEHWASWLGERMCGEPALW